MGANTVRDEALKKQVEITLEKEREKKGHTSTKDKEIDRIVEDLDIQEV